MSRQSERNLSQWLREISSLWLGMVVSVLIIGSYNLGILGISYGQWYDPTAGLVPAQTTIRAQHFLELRNAIDNKRELCELTPVTWTDPSLIRSQTPIRAVHINELRLAVTGIYSKLPARLLSFGSFEDAAIDPQTTPIRLVHLTQLRTALEEATCCGDGECNGPEDADNCGGDCLCNYGPWVDGACGVGTCDAFEVEQTKVDDDTPGCDDLAQCVVDFITCCNYGEWQNVGCGQGGCDVSDMAQIQTAEVGCPDHFQCAVNHADCCQYAAAESAIGCGLGDCNANEMLWGKAASREDCPIHPDAVCVPDVSVGEDCCRYQSFVDQGCGTGGGCPDEEMYQTSTALVVDAVYCPVIHQCAAAEVCCGYGAYVPDACGGICAVNEMRETSSPVAVTESCPILERCTLDEAACCGGYSAYIDQNCGISGCAVNEMYQIATPVNPACPDHTRCVPDDLVCCGGYTGYVNQECGTHGCDKNQMYQVNSPIDEDSGCSEYARCVTDEITCCGGYTGYVDQGCWVGGCAANQIYQVNSPIDGTSGCSVYSRCTTNTTICCGGYSGYVNQGCGVGGCAANQIYQVNSPIDGTSGCSVYDQCTIDETTCCGGYSAYVDQGCGAGGCAVSAKYEVSTPLDPASGCPDKTRCTPAAGECCTYGAPVDAGCGGSCALNEMQKVETAPGCDDIYTCVDDLSCSECTLGEESPCTVDGCPGTKTCGINRLYGACVQDPAICTEGDEQGCLNSEAESSYQFCTSCGVWGPCSCTFGDVRACTTPSPDYCPGIRTCANNIWESCQKVTVCTPGTTIACVMGGLPGVQICNDPCGDAYGDCHCISGDTVPCPGGVRTCTSGSWSSCVLVE